MFAPSRLTRLNRRSKQTASSSVLMSVGGDDGRLGAAVVPGVIGDPRQDAEAGAVDVLRVADIDNHLFELRVGEGAVEQCVERRAERVAQVAAHLRNQVPPSRG